MNDDVTPSAAPAPPEHGARAHVETTPLVPALATDAGLRSALVAGLLVTFAMSLLIPLGLVAAHGDGVDPSVLTRVVTLDILLTIATLTAAAVALGSLRLLTAASLVTAGGIVMEAGLLVARLASGSEVPRIGHIALLMLIACPLALWWIVIRRGIIARRWLLLGFVLAVPAATYLPAIVMAVLYVRLDLLAAYLAMVLGIVAAGPCRLAAPRHPVGRGRDVRRARRVARLARAPEPGRQCDGARSGRHHRGPCSRRLGGRGLRCYGGAQDAGTMARPVRGSARRPALTQRVVDESSTKLSDLALGPPYLSSGAANSPSHYEIVRRGVAHGSGLGTKRWVVERGFSWLHQFRRLRTRYEVRADLHLGLMQPACALICWRKLPGRSF